MFVSFTCCILFKILFEPFDVLGYDTAGPYGKPTLGDTGLQSKYRNERLLRQ